MRSAAVPTATSKWAFCFRNELISSRLCLSAITAMSESEFHTRPWVIMAEMYFRHLLQISSNDDMTYLLTNILSSPYCYLLCYHWRLSISDKITLLRL